MVGRKVMFSGGIPADDSKAVFELLSEKIGDRALQWPDGETNVERRGWITGINADVFNKVPSLEETTLELTQTDDYRYKTVKSYRIRPGATVDLRGYLPYAKDAIASYQVFSQMKAEGKIPEQTRFQVSVPGAHDVISISFADADEWPVMIAAWQDALADEYRKILEVIPAEELCVQMDFCTEMIHIGGTWQKMLDWVPDGDRDELLRQYTSEEYIGGHLQGLPEDVAVGMHICCGTSPSYPVLGLDDIAFPVELANAIQKSAGGRVSYFHLPAMVDSDEAYFAPLQNLDVADATIYLGVECNDGLEAMQRRIVDASKSLDDFGVAHYCGYFWNKDIMGELMDTLAAGADSAA